VCNKKKNPFFAGGKWRKIERMRWWDTYTNTTLTVFGHYWCSLPRPLVVFPLFFASKIQKALPVLAAFMDESRHTYG